MQVSGAVVGVVVVLTVVVLVIGSVVAVLLIAWKVRREGKTSTGMNCILVNISFAWQMYIECVLHLHGPRLFCQCCIPYTAVFTVMISCHNYMMICVCLLFIS